MLFSTKYKNFIKFHVVVLVLAIIQNPGLEPVADPTSHQFFWLSPIPKKGTTKTWVKGKRVNRKALIM